MPPSAPPLPALPASAPRRQLTTLWVGCIALLTMASAMADANRWDCEPGADGGWLCVEPGATAPPRVSGARSSGSDGDGDGDGDGNGDGNGNEGATVATPPSERTEPVPATTAPSASTDDPAIVVAHNLDWVDLADLSPDQRANLAPGCCGAYVEPHLDYADAERKPDTAPIQASATTTEAHGDVATLSGDVQVIQGYRQLRSDRAEVDRAGRTVKLIDHVQFREPGVLIRGDRAALDMDAKEVRIDGATFVLHRSAARGTAEKLVRRGDEVIYVDNTTYTTCEPGNNAWLLRASRIEIDPATGMATARNVRVAVRDVPVVYVPWLRFPVDKRRASGLLFPQFRLGTGNGLDYAQPIYLNLAPNYDATLTPRLLQHRGAMLEAEVRHLADWSETIVSGGYLANDDGGSDDNDPMTGERSRRGQDRWLVGVDQQGTINPDWRTRVDYTKVSDTDYFRDLGNSSLEVNSRTHLRQMVRTDYFLPHWKLSLKGEEFQTLLEGTRAQYQQLPQIGADGSYRFAALDLVLDLRNQYTRFDHRDPTRVAGVVGDRLRTDYALTWDRHWPWGYVRPTVMVKHLSYDLDNPVRTGADDSPAITVPVGILDAGLYLEQRVPALKGFIQTLEPRLYYLKSDFKDQSDFPVFDTSELTFSYQQLFRDDRFAGGDRIGDTEQVTLGLTSRLIDAAGRERMRLSAGEILYLDDRRVFVDPTLAGFGAIPPEVLRMQTADLRDNSSDLAGELGVRVSEFWRFQADLLVDQDISRVGKGSLGMRYRNPNRTVFNAAYRYTRDALVFAATPSIEDIEQTDFSFALPVSDAWSLVGRWNHDLTHKRELEVFGGFEYESCCWRIAVLARRWLDRQNDVLFAADNDYNTGLFVEFQFKGLGGVGKQVAGILRDGVYGYIPKDH